MSKKIFVAVGTAVIAILLFEKANAQLVQSTVTVFVIPNAPSDLAAVPISPSEVDLTWTDNSNNETGFSIERKTGALGTYTEIATTATNVASYADDSVSAATTYFYRVRAFMAGPLYSGYSNESSVTTLSTGGGGGGGGGSSGGGESGGGGGGYSSYAPAPTNVTISGLAYPLSQVFILEDGQVALQTVAGPDAKFSGTLGNLSGGNYEFSVYSQDSSGRRSATFSFSVIVTQGATTLISGVFLSPTISVDKSEVKQGDTLTIFGQSIPGSTVTIQVNSAQTIFASASSSEDGSYSYELDTTPLELGDHSTKSKASQGGLVSADSVAVAFNVGNQNVVAPLGQSCPVKGDLNNDCHVNLVDFSMLAYWYKRPGFPAAYDLNSDGSIDLADFSIMAYYWTG